MPRKKTDSKLQKRSLEAAGFYSDCMKEDMLYAVLIRSPASAGSVKSIVLDDIPEGYQLFTAEDIPGSKKIEINKAL